MSTRERDSPRNESAVPVFGSWRNAYCAVIAFFIIDVTLFYFFDRYFS